MNERTEIPRAVIFGIARNLDAWKRFVYSYLQIRVTFVIFQFHVVARLMRFDQVVFKNECLNFCLCHDVINVGDISHELHSRRSRCASALKIGARPMPQTQCLADINHRAIGGFHQVNPRRVG